MNRMNLLPEDLRPQSARQTPPSGFRLLALAALLIVAAYALLTAQTMRLEARIQDGCARIDTLAASSLPAAEAGAAGDMKGPLIKGVLEQLEACVPPDVVFTGLKFYSDAEALTTDPGSVPAPPERMEITGLAADGQAVGHLLTALEYSGFCGGVELASLNRQEDGEFAFTVLGRLSL